MEGASFGRYRLLDQLGRGGMGVVWRAYDTETTRTVALKILPEEFNESEEYKQRFRREARTAAALTEPHIVPIHRWGEIEDRLYVDMRLIEGRSLESFLEHGGFNPARAVSIVGQIGSALDAAHRAGLVHRDVKPSNILLTDDDFAYLIDFGVVGTTNETRLTNKGTTVGTWAYMAPERIRSGTIDPRSDVYALTCVLYECLTGDRPFPGNSFEQLGYQHLFGPPPRPSEADQRLSTHFDRVIAIGMAKKPEERYPTTKELANAARAALNAPMPQRNDRRGPPPPRVNRRQPDPPTVATNERPLPRKRP